MTAPLGLSPAIRGSIFLVAVGVMTALYATRPGVWAEHRLTASNWREYRRSIAAEASAGYGYLNGRSALASGAPGPRETLMLRELLARWQLRAQYPEMYTAWTQKVAHRPGATPDAASLAEAVEQAWSSARAQAPAPQVQLALAPGEGVDIRFAPGTPTAAIGGALSLILAPENERVAPKFPPALFWSTGKEPEASAARRRLGEYRAATATTSATVRFDLSHEPAWLAPGATAGVLRFRTRMTGAYRVAGIAFE